MERDSVNLTNLPSEIVLIILDKLSPKDIISLSSTSRNFNHFIQSDDIWRPFIHSLTSTHSHPQPPSISLSNSFLHARFLLPNATFLGYSISSTPYSSRIIRLSISNTTTTPTILASQLIPNNRFSLSSLSRPPLQLPLGCILDPTLTSYTVPTTGPGSFTPDKGLSVDLLEPEWKWLDLFSVTPASGAILSMGDIDVRRRTGVITPTLRLNLVKVSKKVKLGTGLDEGGQDVGTEEFMRRRFGTPRDLFSLFTGRNPSVQWPTRELVKKGAMRRAKNWITEQRDEVDPELSHGDREMTVSGFHLQVRRKVVLSSTSSSQIVEERDDVPRRRGVGPNGGPAILYHGQERDPHERRGVAVLRAGEGDNRNGFVFHFPPTTDPTTANRTPTTTEESEEIVQTRLEEFFPLNSPSSLISFDAPTAARVNEGGAISAASLEGLWCGTYGPHGIEFGWLNVEFQDGDPLGTRDINYVKVTGDANVPSGQVSWVATLPPVSTSSTEGEDLGTVPSITNAQLLRWSSYDPAFSSDTPQWDLGTCSGRGRIALSGFISPSWSPATITFIRSEQILQREVGNEAHGEVVREEKKIEVVDEIRVRWRELGHVSCFRRVRI